MATKKLMEFSVMVHIDAVTDVKIKAESWEQAVAAAKALKMLDACDLAGDYIDGKGIEIQSIYRIDI